MEESLEKKIKNTLKEAFAKKDETERKNKFMSGQEIYELFSRQKDHKIVSANDLFDIISDFVDDGTLGRYSKFTPDSPDAKDKIKNYPDNLYIWVK